MSDDRVLDAVRSHWAPAALSVAHVAVGFGGWHWRVDAADGPVLFATLDPPRWHTADSLEAAYASAGRLADDLSFVLAPLPRDGGGRCVPLDDGWLSVTPWVAGSRPERFGAEAARAVSALHAAPAPATLRTWAPAVGDGLVEEVRGWTDVPWDGGPFGAATRTAVRDRLGDLAAGLRVHRGLVRRLDPDTYVVTHGEPGVHNQWRGADGRLLLIDWESVRSAPAERDLLGEVGEHVEGDPDLLRLFWLEWALDEVRSYSDWLRGPHADDADTRVAARAVLGELDVVSRLVGGGAPG